MIKRMIPIVLAISVFLVWVPAASAKKNLSNKRPPTPPHSELANEKDRLTLEIAGPSDSRAAEAFQKAFAANGLAAKVQENKKGGKPLRVMTQVDKSSDLSAWSKVAATALPTKKGQQPPGVELVIFAPLTKENSQQAIAQLEKVKGVDAKHSTADIKKGALRVRISGTDKVTAEEISKAIQSAGVTGQFAKAAKVKKT